MEFWCVLLSASFHFNLRTTISGEIDNLSVKRLEILYQIAHIVIK